MKTLLVVALAIAFVVPLHAQDLAPELAPLVAKHKADLAALDAQKAAAIARAQQPYLAALDSAEKTATTAGALEVVATITKEREALKTGLMAPALPEGLPKTLQPARKSCLDATARVSADAGPRQRAIDAEYLRALAALQPKAAANAELAKQIAAEKESLLANASSATGDKKPAAVNSRNVVVNGTFDAADADGRPRGWTFYGPGAEGLMKVVREGSNSFLQMVITGAPLSVGVDQHIPVPPRAKAITLRARIRGKATDHHANDPNWGGNVLGRFFNADGKELGGPMVIGGREAGWKSLAKNEPIPTGAKEVVVACTGWWVSGIFDFDEVEVEFR